MRNHRMFNTKLITDDRFTALPPRAQMLYFQLIAYADDEGFVGNIRTICSRKTDLNALVDAGLLILFGTAPALIVHWFYHNSVKSSHAKQTMYTAEKALVTLDEQKIYHLKNEESDSRILPPKEKKSKEKKSKEKRENAAEEPAAACGASLSQIESDFELFWNAYPNKQDRAGAFCAFKAVDAPIKTILAALEQHKSTPQWVNDGGAFIPKAENWLRKRRWEDIRVIVPAKIPPKTGATGRLGPEELAAIQRTLAES